MGIHQAGEKRDIAKILDGDDADLSRNVGPAAGLDNSPVADKYSPVLDRRF